MSSGTQSVWHIFFESEEQDEHRPSGRRRGVQIARAATTPYFAALHTGYGTGDRTAFVPSHPGFHCISSGLQGGCMALRVARRIQKEVGWPRVRSEEHTSELQSRGHLVCRLMRGKTRRKRNGMRQQWRE